VKTFTTFDGIAIAYDVMGEGPCVLLHHGFASESSTNWVRPGVAGAVAESGRSVVLIDARGHGQSDKPHDLDSYRGGAMARDVTCLLDHLGREAVHLIGYSMGAFVAITFASADPADARLRSIVLGGAGRGQASMASREAMLVIADALEAEDKATITDATGRAFRNFADATHADRVALAALQRSRSPQPDLSALERITVPTLVVNGTGDTMVGRPQSFAESIQGARFVAVPGDHLSAVVKPEFKAVILDWLDEVAPTGG
jgi:pimeloyl-ACP methyl ester carboxylesterase